MADVWQRRIDRAHALAKADVRGGGLLTQYAGILEAQRTCYHTLIAGGERLTGSLERDLPDLRAGAARSFSAAHQFLPAAIVGGTPVDAPAIDALLRDGWRAPSAPFLARFVLQPYAEALAALGRAPDRKTTPGSAACPFCGGLPQVSVLQTETGAEGGSRRLICSMCATAWAMRRVLCVHCGEDDERQLSYFHAPEFDHVRVDACESCHYYLKAVDLARLGLAVPVVDEVASAVLDLWAHERGYTKVTPNLIGL
jgi:formate dehydrogenase maturation protein FdhE